MVVSPLGRSSVSSFQPPEGVLAQLRDARQEPDPGKLPAAPESFIPHFFDPLGNLEHAAYVLQRRVLPAVDRPVVAGVGGVLRRHLRPV